MSVRKNIRFGQDMNTALSTDEKNRRVEEVAETLGSAGMMGVRPTVVPR